MPNEKKNKPWPSIKKKLKMVCQKTKTRQNQIMGNLRTTHLING
jgi:hypothetical protein